MGYVYKITNLVNGKVYIGQTVRKPETRWSEHLKGHKNGSRLLKSAIEKYGFESFSFEVFDELKDRCHLDLMESFLIKQFDSVSPKGYNLTSGGESPRWSEESRKLVSEIHTGSKRSIETRAKMSESKMGMKNGFFGKKHSESYLRKISKKVLCESTGEIFSSMTAASISMKIDRACLQRHLDKGARLKSGLTFRRV
jgi:group I intron endonuclease